MVCRFPTLFGTFLCHGSGRVDGTFIGDGTFELYIFDNYLDNTCSTLPIFAGLFKFLALNRRCRLYISTLTIHQSVQ